MSDQSTRPPRMRLGLRVLLFVSLALNLLVVGLVAGVIFTHQGEPRHPSRYADRAGGPLVTALTRQERRAVGRKIRKAYLAERVEHQREQEGFAPVIDALRNAPYDPDLLRLSVHAQLQSLSRKREVGVNVLLDHIDAMNAAERAAYADRLQQVVQQRGFRPKSGVRTWLSGSHPQIE